LRLVPQIPESSAPQIHVGGSIKVHVQALNQDYEGRVSRFADSLDQQTRTMETEVDFQNSAGKLMPGMFCETYFVHNKKPNVLTVPLEAVNRTGDEATVFVVNSQSIVEVRPVKLGQESSTQIEVLSGLADLTTLAAELGEKPAENLIRVRSAQMDVMQAEQFRILHDFDARAPRIFHECDLKEHRHFTRRGDDLDACRFEFLHFRVEVRDGETYVIDGASATGLRVRFLEEEETRAAVHNPVRSLCDPAPAEILLVPIGGRRRIGHVQMDVVVRKRLRHSGADEDRREQDLSHQGLLSNVGLML